MPHLYAIALGSNQSHSRHGRPRKVIEAAIARLEQNFDLFDASATILNPAQGGAGRDFANAVALIQAASDPPAILLRLQQIEREFGRRSGRRWGPRVLDLDIVAWGGGSWHSRKLRIPHPAMEQRAFVLEPLAQIAPGWRVRGHLTVRHLAERLARRRPCR